MPIYELTVVRDQRPIRREHIRAGGEEAATVQAQLRFASFRPGESVVLGRGGSTYRVFGPRRAG